MIGSFANGTTSSLVAKHGARKLSQPFVELQGSNSEIKLITRTYFENKQSRFGWVGSTMVAILE